MRGPLSASWRACRAEAYTPLRDTLRRGRAPVELGCWPDQRGRGLFATRDLEPGAALLREPPYVASYECPVHSAAGKELSALATDETARTAGLSQADRWELVEDASLLALCLFRGAYEAADPAPGAPPLPPPPSRNSSEDDVAVLGPLQLLEHAPLPSALPLAGVQLLHEEIFPLAATLAAEIYTGVAEHRSSNVGDAASGAWEQLMPRFQEAWRSERLLCVLDSPSVYCNDAADKIEALITDENN